MQMGSFESRYNKLIDDIEERIDKKVKEKGVESMFSTNRVLKLPHAYQYNLEADRYITEVCNYNFIDNNGHSYSFACLDLEKLTKIADSL
jgi:hypothetical protein